MITTLEQMLFPVERTTLKDKLGINSIGSTEYGVFGYICGETFPTLLNTCSDIY